MPMTSTNLAVYLREVWSPSVQRALRATLVVANKILDFSSEFAGGAKTLHIPQLANLTANTKTEGTAITETTATETELTLTINTHIYVAMIFEDFVRAISSYNFENLYRDQIAYALAKKYDTDALGLYASLSNSVGNSTSDIDESRILDAIETLDTNDVPENDRWLVLYPTQYSVLRGISRFTEERMTGQSAIRNGVIGELHGVNILKTTQVPITNTTFVHNLLFQREAFMTAVAKNVSFKLERRPEYLADQLTGDMIYAVGVYRDEAAVEVQTQK